LSARSSTQPIVLSPQNSLPVLSLEFFVMAVLIKKPQVECATGVRRKVVCRLFPFLMIHPITAAFDFLAVVSSEELPIESGGTRDELSQDIEGFGRGCWRLRFILLTKVPLGLYSFEESISNGFVC